MIFTVINICVTLFFIFEVFFVEKQSKHDTDYDETNPLLPNILLIGITAGIFTLVSQLGNSIMPSLFTILMKAVLIMEGCLLWNVAFCFPYYAWNYSNTATSIIKGIGYVLIVALVMLKIKTIKINPEIGVVINSDYLFKGAAQRYFPFTWYSVWEAVLRYAAPGFLCGMMLVRNELKASKLDRFKGVVYATGLLSMWIMSIALLCARKSYPAFDLLRFFVYVPMFVIMPWGYRISASPSGRGITSFIVKSIMSYMIPALLMGFIFSRLYSLKEISPFVFLLANFVATGLVLLLVYGINTLINRSRYGHSSDYAASFEKNLASVDYNGEMDEIADNMFHIFKKNTEASSMAVYINGGNDTFEPAYSSNKMAHKIEGRMALLETLLNMGKNIVCYSELESLHSLAVIKDELGAFLIEIKADTLFILNEGRDIHGLITLGIKENKDHFKEYDMNVFSKLYSYFFVFGYYMRNISNKEVIGTVNRELRMSSQIITSIQENIDILNNPKMDAGCVMIPAHNIGGEFVDMIRLTDSRHMFVVGDLSGKGIAASMSMVILKSIIRAYLAETHDFKQLVVKINSFIRNNLQKGTIFAGMFAIVDFEKDMFYYINCGIPGLFLYTEAYSNVIEIQGSGHILGFVKDLTPYITVKSIKLNKNDIILACTDGLIESHNLRGEEFGKDRIERNMVANSMYPASRMAQFQHDELVKFMSHEMEDDVSVLVLKCLKTFASEKAEADAIKAEYLASIMKMEEETGFLEGTDVENGQIPELLEQSVDAEIISDDDNDSENKTDAQDGFHFEEVE